jgi:hypothetical protein
MDQTDHGDYEELDEETLEACVQVFDDLMQGTHYSKQEAALNEMFGVNPQRKVYMP